MSAKKNIKRKCIICDNIFYTSLNRIKWGKGIYCSRNCQYKGMVKKQIRICLVCKETFKASKCSEKRFCSSKCSYKARTLGLVKRKITKPYNCYRRPILYCKNKKCNTKITYHSKSGFCRSCVFKDRFRKNPSLNPFYIDGRSKNKKSYRGDNWNEIRLEIYQRDNYTCQECNKKCISKNMPINLILIK